MDTGKYKKRRAEQQNEIVSSGELGSSLDIDCEHVMQIMEIREAVEDAKETETLNQIQEQMQKELGNWSRSFTDAFQSRKYDKALASIQRMTYYKRAIEEIIKKL